VFLDFLYTLFLEKLFLLFLSGAIFQKIAQEISIKPSQVGGTTLGNPSTEMEESPREKEVS
jgi:hypothetical protein